MGLETNTFNRSPLNISLAQRVHEQTRVNHWPIVNGNTVIDKKVQPSVESLANQYLQLASTSNTALLQRGSSFPIINRRYERDDVLIQNPHRKESYWVPKGIAARAATQAALGYQTDNVLTQQEVNNMHPAEVVLYWAKAERPQKLYFGPDSRMSRIFSQGNGAKFFEDNFYEKFNNSPEKGDSMNNFDYTFTWYPRAAETINSAEQAVGSWQDGTAIAEKNGVRFKVQNPMTVKSLLFGRQLDEMGLNPVGERPNDLDMEIEWFSPYRE